MAHWADVSLTTSLTRVALDDAAMVLLPNEIETKCPMCRTLTTAQPDQPRSLELQSRYPTSHSQRATEEQQAELDETGSSIETLTLYIGNEHRLIRPDTPHGGNKHDWKFFVRPSRTDVVEEVQMFLHPTFRNPRVIQQFPPYEIRRLGWGYFTIGTNIILKAGYSWVSSEAQDAPDGAQRGMLSLDWTLDFHGRGSQGRCRLKVKREKDDQEREEERAREAVRRTWRRQRAEDGDWEDVDD